MKIGWMWFDDDPERSIEEKIEQAARRYHQKFGRSPNTCYVNVLALSQDELRCGEIKVIAVSNILPHHFWLGMADSSPEKRRRKRAS
ncbi:MAG: hypothetical protein ACETWB_07055 [Anaerolineae bacterium]